MKIRLATLDDIPQIIEVANEWHTYHVEANEQREKTLRETLNKGGHVIFVAEKNGEILGWFDVRYYKDWFVLRKSVHIEHINVAAKYRNKGIGSQICQAIIDHFKDEEEDMYVIFYYSETGNPRFFNKNGLQTSGQQFLIKRVIKKPRNDNDNDLG